LHETDSFPAGVLSRHFIFPHVKSLSMLLTAADGRRDKMPERQRKQRAPRLRRKRIPGYTPEAETAHELNVSVRTLRKWRQEGAGPSYVKFGRQIHYSNEGRAAWLKAIETRPVRSKQAA
jgi:hypothetical protein